LRLVFSKGDAVKYISHLDMMRLWERALRRANMPLLYSKGFNPRPRISMAAPLAVGLTGRREVMDVFLERIVSPFDFATGVSSQLPSGITLSEVEEVYAALPSLQSQVSSAEYRATVQAREPEQKMERRLEALLSKQALPRERRGKVYDLRPLIESLWLEEKGKGDYVLGMRLRTGENGTGRPDEVLAELGLAELVKAVERARLFFPSPAGGSTA
jgi:radical SAM-linked protein